MAVKDAVGVPTATSTGSVQIEPVTDNKGLLEVVKFPFKLYRDDPLWVPPFIEERMDYLSTKKNPFFEHARAQLFLAKRKGEIVGTVGAVIDDDSNTFHNEKVGGFGFFESIDDQEVATALLRAAEDWIRKQGMTIARGPMNFSSNNEWGLLVDGVPEPPMILMTYNPKYYMKLIENAGYQKKMDLFAYIADVDERIHNAPPRIFRIAEKAAQKRGIRVRKARIQDFDKEVKYVQLITNKVWVNNWGFVPITDHEASHMAASLRPIIDPDLVLIAETADGKPIGVSLTFPDLHQALKWSGGGRMFPFGILKFLWHRRKINQMRLALMGVDPEYRNLGIDAIFYVETARIGLAKGHKRIEGSWVLEVNTMMNQIIERLGGVKYKTYRIYEKAL